MTNTDLVNRRFDGQDTIGHFQLYEIDRRIKDKLRHIDEENKKQKNLSVVGSIASFIKHRISEKRIESEQDDLSNSISIADTNTVAYQRLRTAIAEVRDRADLIGDEDQRVMLLPGQPQIGDMKFFRFEVPTLNLSINGENMLISPHYIFRFDNGGKYKCTYSPLAIAASLVTYSRKSKKDISRALQRSLLRREKGTSGITDKDLIDNVLKLEIAEVSLFFAADVDRLRKIEEVVSAYSETEVVEEFDPAFHIMGLLKRCDLESKNVKRLEALVNKHKTE
ncbi:hypothetical protein [Butyrivibrio sp.]|uniref:hypothetical protein n=1 Tax=Butyrivibrio sp. TaxID=28121 RepID=UPI0025B96BFE|nr:hypothetical protein [Butyrivibrio sp.]MBE5837968.1 hypothetical protein [Butyrivibrio sp.]